MGVRDTPANKAENRHPTGGPSGALGRERRIGRRRTGNGMGARGEIGLGAPGRGR